MACSLIHKKQDRVRKIGCLVIAVLLLLVLTACRQETNPAENEPSGAEDVQNHFEQKYEGKIKEARDYLLQHGIKLSEVITQDIDGDEKAVTWDDLCKNKQTMALNIFLNKAIEDISSQNNYSPVNLRSYKFLLQDEVTVAEIYFYRDAIIGGVTYLQEEILKEEKRYSSLDGKTPEEFLHLNYQVWQAGKKQDTPNTSKATIYYLDMKQPMKDGFEDAVKIQSLDQGRFLVTYQKDSNCRVYFCDTDSGSDFYTGISFADYPQIRVKSMDNDKSAIFLPDKMLIVNSLHFIKLEEIKYPEGEDIKTDDLDISPDGQFIAYTNKNGLIVCDNHFQNRKVIVKSKIAEDDLKAEATRYPIFSPDSSRIMYRHVGYEWLIGTGVVTPDGSEQKYFIADKDEVTYTHWYDESHIYSSGPAYGELMNPVLFNIETGETTYLVREAPKDKRMEYFLGRNNQLYYQEIEMNQASEVQSVKFGLYDTDNQTWHKLVETPEYYYTNFYSFADDSINKNFGLIIYNQPFWSRPAILSGI